jgi:PAS domain S-box-containing protein
MTSTTERSELAKVLVGVGNLLPDLFAIFDADKLTLIQINTAGRKLLDPSGKRSMDKIPLTDIIGINDIDRFRRDVHAQARVLGSWSGVLVLRDFLGSEFNRQVKLLEIPGIGPDGGRCLCLHASETTQESAGKDLVSDPDILSALMETSPNSIFFKDTSSRYLRISRTKAKKHGLTDPRDAIGKTDFDYFDVEHAARAFEEEQRILKTNEPLIDREEQATLADGTVIWVSTMKFPFYNREGKLIGTYGLSRDITAQKMAEEAMRKNEATLQSIYHSAPIGIALVQGRNIMKVNDLLCKIADRTSVEIVGKSSLPLYLNAEEHARAGRELYDNLAERRISSTEVVWRHKDGSLIDVQMTAAAIDLGDGASGDWRIVTVLDVTEKKRSEEKLRMLSSAVDQSPISIVITDIKGRIEYVNPYFEKITGYSAAEAIGQTPRILKSGYHTPEYYQVVWETISAGREWNGEFHNRRKDGGAFWERATICALHNQRGEVTHYVAVKEDITERKRTEEERLELETRSQLSQKLQSVGMLAAGVAHEINTPTQYITDNTRFLTDSFTQLFKVIGSYRGHNASHPECTECLKAVAAAETENELDYLLSEIPRTLEQSLEGLGRISRIVSSLKEFSHPNQAERTGADLNKAIETTVAVSRHEWKYVADVVTEFDPKLPHVECILDEFNQVVLNLVINATHAVGDALKQRGLKRGTITIRTRQEPGWAVVEVEDTGTGIPPEVRGKIFDPFFTTKGIGKGTGQGLAIVQAVVVTGHAGRVDFTTEVGKGTTFRLYLPLASTHPSRASLSTPATP